MKKIEHSGFTLVELAVVIFLIGLMATMGLAGLKAQMASAAMSATTKKEMIVRDALIAYLGKNGKLPFPANPDGSAVTACPDSAGGICWGIVPYQTLGLSKGDAMDGWDNFFSYAVSANPATANTNWTSVRSTISYVAANTGVITATDRVSPSTNIAAVIISHGINGFGAYTSKGTLNVAPDQMLYPDEYQNAYLSASATPTFYNRSYTDKPQDATTNPGGAFDDIVLAIAPNDLLTPLIKDGALQSAQSQYATLIASIQDYVAANITSSGGATPTCTVPSLSIIQAKFPSDPWGSALAATTPFSYTAGSFSSGSASSAVFTISNSNSNYAGASPSYSTMIRLYPFLTNLGC